MDASPRAMAPYLHWESMRTGGAVTPRVCHGEKRSGREDQPIRATQMNRSGYQPTTQPLTGSRCAWGGGRGDGGSHAEQLMLGKERKRRQRGSTEFGLADVLQRSCAHLQGHTHPTPSVIQPSSGRSCCIGRNRFWNASQEM